jgi:nitrite reductase (cytochrome c-552)
VPYQRAGNGDLFAGFEALNRMPYREAVQNVTHPVSCIDCHEPRSMRLRVTRPAFMEGIARAMQTRGIDDFDVNEDASRHEMRTYVCAQCHVEYYFQGPEKRLTYPWFNGLRADEILSYYEEIDFSDFTHATSGARVLKAQHPEFEMYSQGIHAQSGVTCSDCHMPYIRQGAMKVSDHWVRSPLLMVDAACQTCHRWSEDDLRNRVHTIQDRTYQMRNLAMDAVLQLADAIAREAQRDSTSPRVAEARRQQRRAQFLTDFVEAENSMGFHADQESVRVLGLAINYARIGLGALHGETFPEASAPVRPPVQTVTPPVRGAAGSGH